MDKLNMLSAKKVKLHGITSEKWTTRDKITQYKGLINLYTRDRHIIDVDTNVANKRQYKELLKMQKDIVKRRAALDNAIRGDKQQLRNTLQEHKDLQLAYQNTQPKKVIDNVEHINFKKRKELDRLVDTLKTREQTLIDLKLEVANIEDRLTFEKMHSHLPVEKQSQIIAGKVQDAILKQEAALAIKQTYAQIIDIMKKDALYFDAILATVKNDGIAQTKCMINATTLGQLATEYLDDRKREYEKLEKLVLKEMKAREMNLTVAHDQVTAATAKIKYLIRRDSDTNTCFIKLEESFSFTDIQKDLQDVEKVLDELRTHTFVPDFGDIYFCLTEQDRQKDRLRDFVEKGEENRDRLYNKLNHAQVMSNELKNSMIDTTLEYRTKKKELMKQIQEQVERKETGDKVKICHEEKLAHIRIHFNQLLKQIKFIRVSSLDEKAKKKRKAEEGDSPDLSGKAKRKPSAEITDFAEIMDTLTIKLTHLFKQVQDKIGSEDEHEAYLYYESMVKNRIHIVAQAERQKEGLLEGLTTELSHVITREDIKKQSDEIVYLNKLKADLL